MLEGDNAVERNKADEGARECRGWFAVVIGGQGGLIHKVIFECLEGGKRQSGTYVKGHIFHAEERGRTESLRQE